MLPYVALMALAGQTYRTQHIDGWTVLFAEDLVRERSRVYEAARAELTSQLDSISRVVPDAPLAAIRKVKIWVHTTSPGTVCMAYHPGADWLREHGMEPAMAKCVEIGSASKFVSWTYEQPWMVLHELAHAYHDQVLPRGFDNPDVKAAYAEAMLAKRYESVRHWDGAMVRAYAATNEREYFAECTEAYFGTNDFFPFVRGELMNADPDGYALMKKEWGEPQKRVPD
jgi:hypothetical protein